MDCVHLEPASAVALRAALALRIEPARTRASSQPWKQANQFREGKKERQIAGLGKKNTLGEGTRGRDNIDITPQLDIKVCMYELYWLHR